MTFILQTKVSNAFLMNENLSIANRIPLKYIPCGVNDNNPTLVKVMAWLLIGYKPLSEPIMA